MQRRALITAAKLGRNPERAKVNPIIAQAKAAGEIGKMALKWLGGPAGELSN
jgi:polar amino acid transport system substrate-binding protein